MSTPLIFPSIMSYVNYSRSVNHIKCKVTLNPAHNQGVFFPGEIIKGCVVVSNVRNQPCLGIVVMILGEANVQFKVAKSTQKKRSYVYQIHTFVCGSGRHFTQDVRLPKVENQFFFSLPLGEAMPYSFESKHGSISYELVTFWRFEDSLWKIASKPLTIRPSTISPNYCCIFLAHPCAFRLQKSSKSFLSMIKLKSSGSLDGRNPISCCNGGTSASHHLNDERCLLGTENPFNGLDDLNDSATKLQLSFVLHKSKFTIGSKVPFTLSLRNFKAIQHFKVNGASVGIIKRTSYYGDSATKATSVILDVVHLDGVGLQAILINPSLRNGNISSNNDVVSWWDQLRVPDGLTPAFRVGSSCTVPPKLCIIKLEYILRVEVFSTDRSRPLLKREVMINTEVGRTRLMLPMARSSSESEEDSEDFTGGTGSSSDDSGDLHPPRFPVRPHYGPGYHYPVSLPPAYSQLSMRYLSQSSIETLPPMYEEVVELGSSSGEGSTSNTSQNC